MKEPIKIIPKSEDDYLRVMTRAVFQSGFNWQIIENKWSGFEEAFSRFNVEKVASFNDADLSELFTDTRIVRNRTKILATIHNARAILAKGGEFGSFKKYLDSFNGFEDTVKDLRKSFKWLGDFGSFYFLWVVSQPTPSYHAWCKSRGIKPIDISK